MHANPLILKHSCGLFVKDKGSSRVIHFNRYWPHLIDEATELWELASLRLLRHAKLDGTLEGLSLESSSLSMIAGYCLGKIMERRTTRPSVYEAYCGASILFESLKFWHATANGQKPPLAFSAGIKTVAKKEQFLFFHQELEKDVNTHHLHCIDVLDEQEQGRRIVSELGNGSVVAIVAHKENAAYLTGILQSLVEYVPSATAGSVFLLFRATRDSSVTACNIHGTRFPIPALQEVCGQLAMAGWHTTSFFVPDFDKDYLLPFSGSQGMCMLHAARTPDQLLNDPRFTPFTSQAVPGGKALALRGDKPVHSYESLFSWDLPTISADQEPNWQKWADKRRWDPTAIDWSKQKLRHADEVVILSRMARAGSSIDLPTFLQYVSRLKNTHTQGTLKGAIHLVQWLLHLNASQDAQQIIDWIFSIPLSVPQLVLIQKRFHEMQCTIGVELALLFYSLHPATDQADLMREVSRAAGAHCRNNPDSAIALAALAVADFRLGSHDFQKYFRKAASLEPANKYLQIAVQKCLRPGEQEREAGD